MSIDILQNKIRKMKNPSACGLDLSPELIPETVRADALSRLGDTPAAAAESFRVFGAQVLDALADVVPAVKFQPANYLRYGHAGAEALEELCALAGKKGFYVIVDALRGDVETTAEIASAAYFGADAPFPADAVTLNGYTGSDGVKPYLPYCREQGKNVFLLVRSSNKSSREVQDLISGDRVVHTVMADLAMRWSGDLIAKSGYSELGVIVGATHPAVLRALREKYDRLFFLVPGYGAQGGTARDAQYAFDRFGRGALVCASRSLIGAWQKEENGDYAALIRAAAEKMRSDLAGFVTVI